MYPLPVTVVSRAEYAEVWGRQITRFYIQILNHEQYPDSLFTPSPHLPPCGLNWSSSRTWVDLYTDDGHYLNGFCSFRGASNLNRMWFATTGEVTPPRRIYVLLRDRECKRTYISNAAPVIFSRYLPRQAPEPGWTWRQARDRCEEIGAHLATLTSRVEDDYAGSLIRQQLGAVQAGVYLGLADGDEDGCFEWITGEPFVFANWAAHEPAGAGPYGFKLMGGRDESGPWRDAAADDARVENFLCEVPLFVDQPAVAAAGRDVRVECEGQEGTRVPVFGDGSYDSDDGVLFYRWAADTCSFVEEDAADTEAVCPVGENLVRLTVIDPAGAGSTDDVILAVYDDDATTGGITAPADGACLAGPVVVQDDFVDRCGARAGARVHAASRPGRRPGRLRGSLRRRAGARVHAASRPALRRRRRLRRHAERRR